VSVVGDTALEFDESYNVLLSNPKNGVIGDGWGTGTILSDDTTLPALSIDDVTLTEGNAGTTTATFTVTMSSKSDQTVTVDYATADGTATTGDNDYLATSGTLRFDAGVTTQKVAVAVLGDTSFEQDETFFVNLSNPTNAAIADGQGLGTITNDDSPPPLSFYTVTPCRVFDSRDLALGGPTPFAAGSQNTVTIAGHCGITAAAAAVSLNVTVTAPTTQGHLRLFPSGAALPSISTINYVAGQTRANNAITPLGTAGALGVYVNQSSGSVHVIIDVNGYFE
jgi:large repetitive protein